MEQYHNPVFEKPALIMQLYMETCWMDPFIRYLDQGELPEDKNEAKKIISKVGNYLYKDGVLFKRRNPCHGSNVWDQRKLHMLSKRFIRVSTVHMKGQPLWQTRSSGRDIIGSP